MITIWIWVFMIAAIVALTEGAQNLRSFAGLQRVDGHVTLGDRSPDLQTDFIRSGRRCGTKEPSEASIYAADELLATISVDDIVNRAAKINIELYIHILEPNHAMEPSVTDLDVSEQLHVLNAAFAQVGFRFVLSGITRTGNSNWNNFNAETSHQEQEMKAALRIGGAAVLNVFIVDNGEGALGWSTFPFEQEDRPTMDGVVIDQRTLPGGTMEPYNRGVTLIHQVGHWLGLYHPFQGGCSKYAQEGDGIGDTPAAAAPHYGCPNPHQPVDSCPGYEMQLRGNDLTQNYMDYGDDQCLSQFTAGQSVRMLQNWKAFRSGR